MSRLPIVRSILTILALLGWSGSALAYDPPQRVMTLRITSVSPSFENDFCDKFHQYMKLTVDGSKSGEIDVPFSFDGKGGGPLCKAYATTTESFDDEITRTVTRDSCREDTIVSVKIEMFEHDGWPGTDDVEADISLDIDYTDPNQLTGCHDEGTKGGFCWEFEVLDEELADSDGDGLKDIWEIQGVDIDCDGEMNVGQDLFLHQMGANPNHKDLFLEINWFSGFEPDVDDLNLVKDMFDRAPVDAGGIANPDGQPGINLIIDAGGVINDIGVHSIGGTDFGNSADSPNSTAEFHEFVDSFEDVKRVGFFRQMVLAPIVDDGALEPGVAGLSVGNDRMQVASATPTTLAHEFGHALSLKHGGELDGEETIVAGHNCKPNQVSIMNYLYSSTGGIRFETGGSTNNFFLDFSPSKVPDDQVVVSPIAAANCPAGSFGCNRRLPLLPDIYETALNEVTPLIEENLGDILIRHHINYGNPSFVLVSQALWDPVDWDDDPATSLPFLTGNPDVVNSLTGDEGCQSARNGTLETLSNLDEWSKVILPPGRGVIGASLIANPNEYKVDNHPPFTPELITAHRRLVTDTDLAIVATLTPTPLAVGETGTLQIEVANTGHNPASLGTVDVTVPLGTNVVTVPDRCSLLFGRTYRCSTAIFDGIEDRALLGGNNTSFTFELVFEANTTGAKRYVYANTYHEGIDPDLSDNAVAVEVITQPAFLGFDDPTQPWVVAYTNGTQVMPTTSTNVTDGSASLPLDCGNKQSDSPSFDTAELGLVGSVLSLDVWVPEEQDPYWVGEVQLTVDVPSANVWGQWIGTVQLTGLPRNTWNEIAFSLPVNVVDALLGDYPDARFRVTSNVATCGYPVLIDSLRFDGAITVRTLFHPSDDSIVVSSSVLTFDDASEWSTTEGSAGIVLPESGNIVEGQGALAVEAGSWSRIVSEEFSTTDLVSLTTTLSVDVHVPDLPPDYYWLGHMNAFLKCPSAGLWDAYIGYQPLQILFDDEYNRVRFELPGYVQAVLQGDYDDCRFSFEIASNQTFGPFLLDNGGFVQ